MLLFIPGLEVPKALALNTFLQAKVNGAGKLVDAVEALASGEFIGGSQVCIVGASYGDYARIARAAFEGSTYKCAVSINGVADINAILKSEKREKNRFIDVYAYWNLVIRNNNLSKWELDAFSPAIHASNFQVPTLVIYGTEDEVVLPEQSKKMIRAVKKVDKPVEELKIPRECNNFSKEALKNSEKYEIIPAFISILWSQPCLN